VRLVLPAKRPYQLRYDCPVEKREVRISTGTRDEAEAKRLKRELEAKLVLGISPKLERGTEFGPGMSWSDFREQYRVLHLATLRDSSAAHTESRLDLAERILKPRRLTDIADANSLQQLQARLLAGAESRRGKPRSAHTVRGYITSVLSVINWAYLQGWLPAPVRIRKLKVGKMKVMKGRPLTEVEFEQMRKSVSEVVGDEGADSWKYVLRGLWESALRLNELMHVSWDIPGTIRPVWKNGVLPILDIPATMQKNDTEEEIPLLPWFEAVLLETPSEQRTGWVFKPMSLKLKLGRKVENLRPDADWVGKIISRIGKKAEVVVEQADERTGRPVKYASAHDLRRSCGERMRNAGVPPLVICRILRHASWETTRKHYAPGDVQQDAAVLKKLLVPATSVPPQQRQATTIVDPEDDKAHTPGSPVSESDRRPPR